MNPTNDAHQGTARFPSERVEICYAMIYPATTIVKIVLAQVLIALGRAGY